MLNSFQHLIKLIILYDGIPKQVGMIQQILSTPKPPPAGNSCPRGSVEFALLDAMAH